MIAKLNDRTKLSNIPNDKWQSIGNEFVKRCETFLWGKTGLKALKYLHSLGLKDETLRKYHLGFNPVESFEPLERCGLPAEVNKKGNPSKVWLPRGIVIPWYFENGLSAIKIHKYLTQEQKSKGEQSEYFVKGSLPGFFGTENLQDVLIAFFSDNEFDAMLLDQEAGDLVGVASFGKPAKNVSAPHWAEWAKYLLPLTEILVPENHVEEKIIQTDSLPNYSGRVRRIDLPNVPKVKFITDLRKVDGNPREWLLQNMKPVSPDVTNQPIDDGLTRNINPMQEWIKIDFNEHRMIDPTILPTTPCYSCKGDKFWQRPDGGWVCGTCHPQPMVVEK